MTMTKPVQRLRVLLGHDPDEAQDWFTGLVLARLNWPELAPTDHDGWSRRPAEQGCDTNER
jgi:hypothetical protein